MFTDGHSQLPLIYENKPRGYEMVLPSGSSVNGLVKFDQRCYMYIAVFMHDLFVDDQAKT